MNEPEVIRRMLGLPPDPAVPGPRTIAVVGLSPDPAKTSHRVSAYMQQHSYRIFPVNPTVANALNEPSYASLADLPLRPDIVNVFRLPKFIPAIVDEMIALRLPNLWVQQGLLDPVSAARAEQAGIHVVMDRCIMVEHHCLSLARNHLDPLQ